MDICPVWLASSLNTRLRLLFHNPHDILGRFIKKGCRAADIGCGPGYFALPMAEMVGPEGRVLAVDLQAGMLDILRRSAERAGLQNRIVLHQCRSDSLGVDETFDFVLSFWMVHEVPNLNSFFAEIASLLKPGGFFLLVEPKIHLSLKKYELEVEAANKAGLTAVGDLPVKLSRAMLFST